MQQGEEWTRLLAPKASEENGHEVYDHTMVVDLKQLSLKRFRKVRSDPMPRRAISRCLS